MIENVCFSSEHLFLVELSPCHNVMEFIAAKRADPVKRGLGTFSSFLSTVFLVKNCRSKKARSEIQSEDKEKRENPQGKL